MRKNRRNRAAYGEESYWQSYSDMMAALLLIFILIIAITLSIYKQKTNDLELTRLELDAASLALDEKSEELKLAQYELDLAQQDLDLAKLDLEGYRIEIEESKTELENSLIKLQDAYEEAKLTREELDAAYLEIDDAKAELAFTKTELKNIVGIRTDIIGELQSKFNNSSMKVDPQNGSITFSSDVLFDYGKATLTKNSKESLKEIIPIYLNVLLQDAYKDYIAEIIIEGHTDTSGTYKTNMELSTERAMSVAEFCLDKKNGLSEAQITRLQTLLTVNGRSFSAPIYKGNTKEIDMDASRRVEIKFRLKEDEMIDKISEILGQ